MKTMVIGAGISGIMTAYSLATRGVDVVVIDSESYPAMKTSYANGGQFSVSNSEVWNTWSNVFKGLKWMLKKDAPLLINPIPTYSKLRWLSEFFGHVITDSYESNTSQTIELGLRARGLYLDIIRKEGIKCDLKREGIMHIYRNQSYLDSALKALSIYEDHGVDRVYLTPSEARGIDPTIPEENIIGAIYTPDDMNGDIHKLCVELHRVLRDKYKVQFFFDTRVDDIYDIQLLMFQHRADNLVVCAGVYSKQIGKMFGDNINIYPVKGYSITVPVDDPKNAPRVSLLDDEKKIVSSTLNDRFRIAGTAELNGYDYDIRNDRVEPLKRWVRENFPNLSLEHAVPWAGLRPMTPSMLPIIKKSGYDPIDVYYNTGHGHLGLTLSAATADLVAGQILGFD